MQPYFDINAQRYMKDDYIQIITVSMTIQCIIIIREEVLSILFLSFPGVQYMIINCHQHIIQLCFPVVGALAENRPKTLTPKAKNEEIKIHLDSFS